MITFEDFKKMSLKVARITEVKEHPDADKLYVLKIDLGGEEREVVAGIKMSYSAEKLKDKLVVVVDNLKPATIRGVESKGMVLAAQDGEILSLICPDRNISPGSPVK